MKSCTKVPVSVYYMHPASEMLLVVYMLFPNHTKFCWWQDSVSPYCLGLVSCKTVRYCLKGIFQKLKMFELNYIYQIALHSCLCAGILQILIRLIPWIIQSSFLQRFWVGLSFKLAILTLYSMYCLCCMGQKIMLFKAAKA